MTKLTLSVDQAVVEKARQIAEADGTSISAMFSHFVESVAAGRRSSISIGPLTRQASGLAKLPSNEPDKELLTKALIEQYGIGR